MGKNENKDDVIRINIVGDGNVGKTFMLVRYVTNELPSVYEPTIFETYGCTVGLQEKRYNVILSDTSGQEYSHSMRSFSYSFVICDCFLICFSVNSRTSFENIRHVWMKDVRKANRKARIIVVGTKCDLRNTQSDIVTKEEALELSRKINAQGYMECSAYTNEGIDDVFNEAVKISAKKIDRRNNKCVLL